jgi:hypothetical protein
VTTDSYLARFVGDVRDHDGGVFTTPDADGRHRLAEFYGRRFDPPIVLEFTEAEFDDAIKALGRSGKELWPEVPPMDAGLRLALVHLTESMATLKHEPTRMYFGVSGLMVG